MSRQKLDNKSLDAIGKRLIASGRVPSADIDKIVSNRDLFTLLGESIAANDKRPSVTTKEALPFIRRNAAAFAGVAMVLITAIGVASFLRSEDPLFTAKVVQVPGAVPAAARSEVPPEPFVGKLSAGRASNPQIQTEYDEAQPTPKKSGSKPQTVLQKEPDGDFYALSFGGDQDESVAGGHIIRVDVPRSSLLALGANIPLENESEVVKADLLIGSDGMTRGIRIVK